MMKTLIAAAALATAIGSSASAQSYSAGYGTGNVMTPPWAQPAASNRDRSGRVTSARSVRGLYLYGGDALPGRRNAFRNGGGDPHLQFQLHRESLQGRW
jgi:hypothetical protein